MSVTVVGHDKDEEERKEKKGKKKKWREVGLEEGKKKKGEENRPGPVLKLCFKEI